MLKGSQIVQEIEIDELTDCIRHIGSGEEFSTVLTPIVARDLAGVRMKKGEWNFNWKAEFKIADREVFKLTTTEDADTIQGLVSISDMGDHYYLHLAESAPHNLGIDKEYEGVGGNLFAFCCKISAENGHEGIIAFRSKTALLEHYEKSLGAVHIGGHKMIIFPEKALFLIDKYFKQ